MAHKFLLFLLLLAAFGSGCTQMIASRFASTMQVTMERQEDIDQVYQGLPSLLLLQESMLSPANTDATLLLTATRSESSYAELLEVYGESDRAGQHARKGASYGCRLLDLSLSLHDSCNIDLPLFQASLAEATEKVVPALFWSASALGTFAKTEHGSPRSLILMPKILAVMNRLVDLDPTYYHGGPHLFLGYYFGSLPVMLGGRPEESKAHFERALEIADRRFLLAQILYAESYARQTLDRDLFEKLLNEVLTSDIEDESLRTANALARKIAEQLLRKIDQLF